MTLPKFFPLALCAVGFATGLISTDPVSAFGNPDRSVKIDYSDLDLRKDKDIRKLERRVANALERVCGSHSMAQKMADIQRIDKCRAQATQTVEPKIAALRKRAEARLWAAADTVERE